MFSVITKLTVRGCRRRFLKTESAIFTIKKFLAIETVPKTFQLFNLKEGPAEDAELELKDALLYYKQMQQIRKMENISSNLYMEKLIRGFLHLYSGEEACCVGIKAIMKPDDTIITSYRCHGWVVVMGETVYGVLAELMGKKTGKYDFVDVVEFKNLLWQ